jgi:hypothetical protein
MSRPTDAISHERYVAIKNYYKAHYTAKEVATILSVSYATASNTYRTLKAAKTQKCSRTVFLGEHNAIAI